MRSESPSRRRIQAGVTSAHHQVDTLSTVFVITISAKWIQAVFSVRTAIICEYLKLPPELSRRDWLP